MKSRIPVIAGAVLAAGVATGCSGPETSAPTFIEAPHLTADQAAFNMAAKRAGGAVIEGINRMESLTAIDSPTRESNDDAVKSNGRSKVFPRLLAEYDRPSHTLTLDAQNLPMANEVPPRESIKNQVRLTFSIVGNTALQLDAKLDQGQSLSGTDYAPVLNGNEAFVATASVTSGTTIDSRLVVANENNTVTMGMGEYADKPTERQPIDLPEYRIPSLEHTLIQTADTINQAYGQ
jgi:hypothetical protein